MTNSYPRFTQSTSHYMYVKIILMSTLNPQILPGIPVSKEEHRRSLTATIVVTILVIILGLIYWSQRPVEQPVKEAVVQQPEGTVALTPEQVQMKQAQIDEINSQKSETLTPAQAKLKAQQIKALSN